MAILATDWIEYHARSIPGKTALIDMHSGRTFDYASFNDRVARVAGMLTDHGIKKGDRVGFLMLNSSDLFEVMFGCWRVGATVLALNFRLTLPEWQYIINNAEASMIIYDDAFAQAAGALKTQTTVKHWLNSDMQGGDSAYERGLATATPIYEMTEQTLDDQCMLMYSSGTTGMPKGVIITHGMIYFSPASGTRLGGGDIDAVTLNNMPLFHIGAIVTTAIPAMWLGSTAVIQRMFDVEQTLDAINDPALGITTLFMVPAAYNGMRLHPKGQSTDFSRIETALCGAETVPTQLIQFWMQRGLVLQEGYGMTETTGNGCCIRKDDMPKMVGSAGKSLMHSKIAILDESGNEVPRGELGEICMKGAAVTPGYWRNDEATQKSFINGWFKSGDIGRMDAEGYIYIEDRIKDMYISGGENVYPAEIENLLYQIDSIAEVAVIGVPDERWGETGCVVAVLKDGTSLTVDDVCTHIGDSVAKYKLPQHIHLVDALPRNATGKVLKFELRKTVPAALGLT